MKFMLVALNSKYIHSSLAVRCLYGAVKDEFDVCIKEFTINDSISHILSNIYRNKPDVVALSCYIWNIREILELSENLKIANPHIKIILGGPEVSFSQREIMEKNKFIDYIISGEGEVTIKLLFESIRDKKICDIDGITYRKNGEIIVCPMRENVRNLDELPFVYEENEDILNNKILYYEASRGCPFSCSYCLSGEDSKVRFLSLDRVKKDIDFFISHNVPLVKFVDRTFNANRKRAYEIFEYIINNGKNTKFHMELAGDLIDDETIDLLKKAPKGIMQFEIGVQTTNAHTMQAINRKIDRDKLFRNIRKLIENGNIHIHIDLIAGLPFEDFNSFRKSFCDSISLKPDVLQLGFLKLLDGSKIKKEVQKYNYRYTKTPPYEVISNDFISYDEILFLHDFEDVFEKYYNNGGFEKTLDKLFKIYPDSFEVFSDIAKYFQSEGLFDISLSKQKLYDVLNDFLVQKSINIQNELKYDYIKTLKSHTSPKWCESRFDASFENRCHEILQDEEFKKKNLPNYFDVPAKKAMKTVHFEKFDDKVILFDHQTGRDLDVTELF